MAFFKQKTAYEIQIRDWSSDVCSSDLTAPYYEDMQGLGDRFARDGEGKGYPQAEFAAQAEMETL